MVNFKKSAVIALLLVLVLALPFLSMRPAQMSGFEIALVGAALVELLVVAAKLGRRAVAHAPKKHAPVLPAA